jgi:hypothetical protein
MLKWVVLEHKEWSGRDMALRPYDTTTIKPCYVKTRYHDGLHISSRKGATGK